MTTIDLKTFSLYQNCGLSAIMTLEQRNMAYGELVCRMKAMICGEEQEPYTYEVFTSWWQHFKAEHFPKWILKRFPAKTTRHVVDIKVLYPRLKAQLPKDLRGDYFTILVNRRHSQKVWSDQPVTMLEMYEKLAKVPMFNMEEKRCPTCGTTFESLFHRA